jgi:uncharacterized protein with von Willebrand factor type A (vWA) domain
MDGGIVPAVLDLVRRLRIAGVPVSMVEAIDAMQALRQVDLANRAQFRSTLAATLVKRVDHEAAFEALFDICFRLQRPAPARRGRRRRCHRPAGAAARRAAA